jgi:GT2 family glycosyltransferase
VIVPVHNADAVLAGQLRALASQVDAPGFEVVVVLNQCADHSRLVADSFRSRLDLTVLDADDQASTAYARNAGAARATAPYLLFCDADDRAGRRWVAGMVGALSATSADIVGCRIVVDRGRIPEWMYDGYYAHNEGADLNLLWTGIRYPIGASFGIRRGAFDAVGGFDESFELGYEEIDLTLRAARQGFRLGVAPRAELCYRPRTTFRGLLRQRRSYAFGGARFYRKEGIPTPARSVTGEVRSIATTVGRLVVREKQWRVTALTARALEQWFAFEAGRRVGLPDVLEEDDERATADFIVAPSTPVVGGLAFRAPRARAYWYATDGDEPFSLGLVDALLRPGDAFVDDGAGVGVFTVSAALRVGRSGRVDSRDTEPGARCMLAANVKRHGVDDRVSIRGVAPLDALPVAAAASQPGLVRIGVEALRRSGESPARAREVFATRAWSVWSVDEARRTVKRLVSSSALDSTRSLLAVPRGRDAEVAAAVASSVLPVAADFA